MDKIELNLDNPIFAAYINVDGMSHTRAKQTLSEFSKMFDIYTNITVWIVATKGDSKIECVYGGKYGTAKTKINLSEKMNLLIDSKDFEEYKSKLREIQIDKVMS